MARLFTIQHTTLTDPMGNPLVLSRQQVGMNHHAVLTPPGTGAEFQFRVTPEGYIEHQGLGGTTGLLTRKIVNGLTYALLRPFSTVEGNQVWSFQHIGPFTFVMLGDGTDPSAPLMYLKISVPSPEPPLVPGKVAMVTLLQPAQLPDLWNFVEIPE